MHVQTVGTWWMWGGFTLLVFLLLAIDLGVFHRRPHAVRFAEALTWSGVWIALALLFNGVVYGVFGRERALEFLTGYLIEKALSVDNIFVFLMLFAFFAVAKQHQHRVLFWGVLGALVMRGLFIFAGAALLARFHWVMYVFGGLLVVTAIKLMLQRAEEVHPERNPVYRLFRRVVPMTAEEHGSRFLVVRNRKLYATPLLMVLVTVEATDVVFAVDSIPAIFAVTRDPFIVYTSNVFAILGLRALYFVLAGVMDRFHYLKPALALVLAFVGVKMLIDGVYPIPITASLAVIASILAVAILASVLRPQGPKTSGRIPESVRS